VVKEVGFVKVVEFRDYPGRGDRVGEQQSGQVGSR
jgi:hypothetical protein